MEAEEIAFAVAISVETYREPLDQRRLFFFFRFFLGGSRVPGSEKLRRDGRSFVTFPYFRGGSGVKAELPEDSETRTLRERKRERKYLIFRVWFTLTEPTHFGLAQPWNLSTVCRYGAPCMERETCDSLNETDRKSRAETYNKIRGWAHGLRSWSDPCSGLKTC